MDRRQWFNIFALRTRRLSVLKHQFNWYLVPAIIFALLIAVFFVYVPKFHAVLDTAAVPAAHWFLPMGFGESEFLAIVKAGAGRKSWIQVEDREYPLALHATLGSGYFADS